MTPRTPANSPITGIAAHDLPRAFEASVAAGRAAEAGYAYPEALAHYERALDLWDQVPDAEARIGRDRVDLLATIAGVARYHESGLAVAHIEAAIRLAEGSAEPVRRGLLYERLGRYAWVAGQGERALEAYATAVRLIPPEPPTEARARAVAGLAQILMLGGRFREARARADEALALARDLGAHEIEGHALNTRGMCRGIDGDIDGAIEDLRTALAIAEEVGVVDDIGRAYANRSWILSGAGRLEEAVALAADGIAATARLGLMRFFGAHLLGAMGDDLYKLGRWDDAEQAARRAEEAEPFGINEIVVQELLARLALSRGAFDEAAERLRPLEPLAERAVDIQFVAPVKASLAELALWQGRPDKATVHIASAIRLVEFSPEVYIGALFALGVRAAADAAELARARRLPDEEASAIADGDAILDDMRRRHAEVVAERPAYAHLSGAWLSLCEAESTRLHREPTPDTWVACREAWERLHRPYVVAYLHWREAEARLAGRGDRDRTVATLRAAHEIAHRLGAEPLLREVTGLAARARLSLDLETTNGSDLDVPEAPTDEATRLGLTTREREVLALVALGRTNRQIADELFISVNTAGVHVSNILGKLGVTSRGEAAATAYRLGLVEPTEG